jgi:uncharacterized protein (DUF4415 family)
MRRNEAAPVNTDAADAHEYRFRIAQELIDQMRTVTLAPPPPAKVRFAMRIDADVLTWFRSQGPGHQTRINQVLRAYFEAMRKARP